MRLKAVIFDLNGTVLADEGEYGKAFKKVLKSLGVNTNEEYPHAGGIGVEENWPIFLKKYKIKTDKSIEELASETQRAYISELPKVALKKGFIELVEELKESGVKIALATSNTWLIVERVFENLEIEKYFDYVTTSEEVVNKKPSPEIFLITLKKLMVEAKYCLVIEDASSGVEASKKANMKVIAIARDESHAKRLQGGKLSYKKLF